MTDGTRPETSAFIGLHYQPAAEADRPDFYPTVLDLVISFFQDEWIEIPRVGGCEGFGCLEGVVGRWVGKGVGEGVITYDQLSIFFFLLNVGWTFFLLVVKSKFFKMRLLHQVSLKGRYSVMLFWTTDHYKFLGGRNMCHQKLNLNSYTCFDKFEVESHNLKLYSIKIDRL